MSRISENFSKPYGIKVYVLLVISLIALMSLATFAAIWWSTIQEDETEELYRNFHLSALVNNDEIIHALSNFEYELIGISSEIKQGGYNKQNLLKKLTMHMTQVKYIIDDNILKIIKLHEKYKNIVFDNTLHNLVISKKKYDALIIDMSSLSPVVVHQLVLQTKEYKARSEQLQALHRVAIENLLAMEDQRKNKSDKVLVAIIILLLLIGIPIIIRVLRLIDKLIYEQKKARDDVNLLLNSTAEGIFGVDLQGKCTFANVACMKLLGYTSVQSFIGKDMFQLVHRNTSKSNEETGFDISGNNVGEYVNSDIFERMDGSCFDAEYWSYPIRQDKQIIGSVITFFDVTEKRMVENTLHVLAIHSATLGFDNFLNLCAKNILQICKAKFIFIASLIKPEQTRLKTLVVLRDGEFIENFECPLEDTLCEDAFTKNEVHVHKISTEHYIKNKKLRELGVKSFFGVPLTSSNNQKLGIIAVMDDKKREYSTYISTVLDVFSRRISIEMERRLAEQQLEHYRDHLEDVVKERTKELVSVNKDLEVYSYSMAHDLRAPLRTITSFSQILAEDAAHKLDDIEMDYLDRIVRAGKNMNQLINDILEYFRLTNTDLVCKEIDLSSVCEKIIKEFRNENASRQVEVTIEPAMSTYGDPHLIKLVLQNLIDNAWKYTTKKEDATISIGSELIDYEVVFFVKDNGVGFNMEFKDKVFEVFQRIHKSHEFEGTGIGMAIVQRIITKHHGRIWVKAKEEEGATFFFVLPRPEQLQINAKVEVENTDIKNIV